MQYFGAPSCDDIKKCLTVTVMCPTHSHPCWSVWIGILRCCWRTGSPVQTCYSAFTQLMAASWYGKECRLIKCFPEFKEDCKNRRKKSHQMWFAVGNFKAFNSLALSLSVCLRTLPFSFVDLKTFLGKCYISDFILTLLPFLIKSYPAALKVYMQYYVHSTFND